MSNISNGDGTKAAETYKSVYNLWFDIDGEKTKYVKILDEKKINVTNLSTIVSGAGTKAPKAFEDSYCLLFDLDGNNSQHLINLETEGIILTKYPAFGIEQYLTLSERSKIHMIFGLMQMEMKSSEALY